MVINKNLMSRNHTAKKRTAADIEYIVIHYVGALGDARANTEYYKSYDISASADFWVGFGGDVWQGNDYYNYYSWHCGGGLQGSGGHTFYQKCKNSNSIGIEMCVRKRSTKTMNATDKDWYFEKATVDATVDLVRQLMVELDIDADHVIRHYDCTGKLCPAPYVHDENAWKTFKARLTADRIWMGWTPYESGTAGYRQTNGDKGRAYGKYQFDYRYYLVPFLQSCVDYSSKYADLKKYIALGAGNGALIYNSGLASLWKSYCDRYPEEFAMLQDRQAYKVYYLEAKRYIKKLYSIDMDRHGPAVKGSLFSMAIRSGQLTGAQKYAGCTDSTSDAEMMQKAYRTYGTQDDYRWTAAKQYGDAVQALKEGSYTEIFTDAVAVPAAATSAPEATSSAPKEAKGDTYMFNVNTVQNGSTGKDAKLMQKLLRGSGYYGANGRELSLDGIIGYNSVYALKNYQSSCGLKADGICGPVTWKNLLGV